VLGEKLVAEQPVRVLNVMLAQINHIRVLDNVPDLHIRKGEGLRQVFVFFVLGNGFVKYLAVEVSDGTVGTDGPGPDVDGVSLRLEVGDFHVRIVPALFFLGP
jgi:hypothetical protein